MKYSLILTFLLGYIVINAQNFENVDMISPEASSLGKLIDTEISYATGIPNISVPVYLIEHGPISIPIQLNYYAGGIKVTDVSNWIGLGWTLSADMMVTRVIKGIPDESDNGYFNTGHQLSWCPTQTALDLSFPMHPCILYHLVNDLKDGEPDLLSYSFPGYSGKFYIGIGENDSLEVRKVDENDLKIEFEYYPDTTAGNRLLSFIIKTPDGLKFTFGKSGNQVAIDKTHIDNAGDFNENWRIVDISTYDDNYKINFDYESNDYEFYTPIRNYYQRYEVLGGSQIVNSSFNGGFNKIVYGKRLSKISYDNVELHFVANDVRDDVSNDNKMLNEIILERGEFCKKWVLNHDYYNSNSMAPSMFKKRLRLTQFQEKVCEEADSTGNIINPFKFEYNGNFLPDLDSKDLDHWGFYNAANNPSNILNIPLDSFTFPITGNTIVIGGANRETNPVTVDTGMLVKIVLPTNGSITYEYEPNVYYNTSTFSDMVCGGLRIKRLIKYDGLNEEKNIIKSYTYVENSNSSGVLFNSNGNPSSMPLYTRSFGLQMGSNPCSYPCPFTGITPGSCGTATIFVGEEESIRSLTSFNGSPIYYKRVIEANADSSRSIYEYDTPDLPPMSPIFTFPQAPDQISLKAGLLKKEIEFEYTSSSNKLETQKSNTFHYTRSPEYFLKTRYYILSFPGDSGCDGLDFEWTIYPIYSGHTNLVRVINILQGVSDTTHFMYDTINHLMPVSTQITNSDGRVFRKEFVYSFDYPDSDIRNELIQKNIISPPFLTKQIVDSLQVDGEEMEFEFFNISTGGLSGTSAGSVIRPYKSYRYEKTFDLNGNLIGPGKSLQYTLPEYDGNGNVASFLKNGWANKNFTWNSDHTLQSSDFEGHTKTFDYFPSSGMLQKSTDVDGQVVSYSFDPLMRLDSIVARNGNVINSFNYSYHSIANPYNYIRTITSYTPVTGSDLEEIESFNYFDGLYRQIQSVNTKASPSLNDVALSFEYDSLGRILKEFRPQQTANNSGEYTGPSGDFTFMVYEPNPLNRIETVTPPSWYASSYQYNRNTTSLTDPEGTIFPTSSLRLKSIIDPDGNILEIYTDKTGREVLKRTLGVIDTADTWTIYDNKSRLKRIYPPGTNIETQNLIYKFLYDSDDNLIYKKVPDALADELRYDIRNLQTASRNVVLENKNQWLVTHYDVFGRPIKRGYHNSAGEPDDPTAPTIDTLLEEYFYDGYNGSTTNSSPIYIGKLKKQRIKMLDDNEINTTWSETEYFYDTYGRLSSEAGINHLGFNETKMYSFDFDDNVTLDIHNISGTSGINHALKHTYDHQGRLKSDIININSQGEVTTSVYNYNYRDELIEQNVGRFATTGEHQYLQSLDFTYNPQGWLTGMNDLLYEEIPVGPDPCEEGSEELMADLLNMTSTDDQDLFAFAINYDQTVSGSGVSQNKNGNITTLRWWHRGNYTQTYSYDYDFLNRISKAVHGEIIVNDYTKLNRYYEDFDYDKRGNILHLNRKGMSNLGMECYTPGTIDSLTFTYADSSNRLSQIEDLAPCPEIITLPPVIDRDMVYAANEIRVLNTEVSCDVDVLLIVDERVNIIDSLKVLNLCDSTPYVEVKEGPCPASKFTEGFNHQSPDGEYGYDDAGNMIYDPNKNLTFHYNHLNLPFRIVGNEDDEVRFFYGSDGSLLRKEYIKHDSLYWKIDYIRGKEYRNDSLETVYHTVGRVVKDSTGWSYEYWLKDHLGNVRVTFADNNDDGVVFGTERRTRNDYYSFGLEHNGIWEESEQYFPKNRFGYNGKEMTEEMNLGMYDYGARQFDPVIGRFITIDRFSHEYSFQSPYAYGANNPIKFIDVNGDSIWIDYKGTDYLYQGGALYQGGKAFKGKVKGFLKQAIAALSKMGGTSEGASMIAELEKSTNNFQIVNSSNNPKKVNEFVPDNLNAAYNNQLQTDPLATDKTRAMAGGSGGTIYWNPSGDEIITTKGILRNSTSDLAHEMFHGLDSNRGLLDRRLHLGVERSEWQATYRENMLRDQLKAPLRTYYLKSTDPSGNILGGTGPRMITPASLPILPSWYKP
ncbi:MAG TPA: RHS repeat-associated core domain-containing protein [Saprospiraceae bacterium]|nr:RHS repeat-associated core domain-containing protein [Saprospiraceae bacterium]